MDLVFFYFLSEEDRESIEGRYWMLGLGSLVLCRWHVGFDPCSERLVRRHLWVMLTDYPIECWNIQGFIWAGNTLGTLILVEDE